MITLLLILLNAQTGYASTLWSGDAHLQLMTGAFRNERADCLREMRKGSEWADSLPNQAPSRSYMHAMRSGNSQTIQTARTQMADFIQLEFEMVSELYGRSTEIVTSTPNNPLAQFTHDGRLIRNMNDYLASCYHRGVGLHPVMDSTSPAHAHFAIWSLSDIGGILEHGDFPGSIESERSLFANPNLMNKTIGLMRLVNKMYVDWGVRDFRFEDTNQI